MVYILISSQYIVDNYAFVFIIDCSLQDMDFFSDSITLKNEECLLRFFFLYIHRWFYYFKSFLSFHLFIYYFVFFFLVSLDLNFLFALTSFNWYTFPFLYFFLFSFLSFSLLVVSQKEDLMPLARVRVLRKSKHEYLTLGSQTNQ